MVGGEREREGRRRRAEATALHPRKRLPARLGSLLAKANEGTAGPSGRTQVRLLPSGAPVLKEQSGGGVGVSGDVPLPKTWEEKKATKAKQDKSSRWLLRHVGRKVDRYGQSRPVNQGEESGAEALWWLRTGAAEDGRAQEGVWREGHRVPVGGIAGSHPPPPPAQSESCKKRGQRMAMSMEVELERQRRKETDRRSRERRRQSRGPPHAAPSTGWRARVQWARAPSLARHGTDPQAGGCRTRRQTVGKENQRSRPCLRPPLASQDPRPEPLVREWGAGGQAGANWGGCSRPARTRPSA